MKLNITFVIQTKTKKKLNSKKAGGSLPESVEDADNPDDIFENVSILYLKVSLYLQSYKLDAT